MLSTGISHDDTKEVTFLRRLIGIHLYFIITIIKIITFQPHIIQHHFKSTTLKFTFDHSNQNVSNLNMKKFSHHRAPINAQRGLHKVVQAPRVFNFFMHSEKTMKSLFILLRFDKLMYSSLILMVGVL